jgi:Raf kinase inhibitor-like YbhB/YbcL family protein
LSIRSIALLAAPLLFIAGVSASPALELHSKALIEGQPLPLDQVLNNFGCEGKNISPDLEWSGAPEGTKSFMITAYDPDVPTGSGWWHWVVFDIPASTNSVAAGAGDLPAGAIQSRTDFGAPGYGGACPPPGAMHRYQFTVIALGTEKLGPDVNTSAAAVGFNASFNTLAKATITVPYTR